MLSLELTDGTKTVDAMEYHSIPSLNEKMQPGLKIRIVGPLECRNHILLLEEQNVVVLGGEVDILLIENAFENMLLREVKKPMNPNPQKEYEAATSKPNSIFRQTPRIQPPSLNARSNQLTNVSDPILNQPASIVSNPISNISVPASSSRSTAPIMDNTTTVRKVNVPNDQGFNHQIAPSHVVSDDPFDDDDIFLDVDLNSIDTQPQTTTATRPTASASSVPFDPQPSTSRGYSKPNYADLFDDDEDDIDALMLIENQMFAEQNACPNLDVSLNRPGSSKQSVGIKRLSSSPTILHNSGPPSKVRKEDTNPQYLPPMENAFDQDFDEFDAMVFQSQDRHEPPPPPVLIPEVKFDAPDYKFRLEGCNVLTFEQLYKIPMEDWPKKTFMFYAGIEKVAKALTITSNFQWNMVLLLTDGNQFEAQMDPILLEKMIEYNAQEIKHMKNKATHQPALREEIITILKKFNDTLKVSNRFWKIRFPEQSSPDQTPTVISIADLKPVYKKILLRKVEAEELYELRKRIPE